MTSLLSADFEKTWGAATVVRAVLEMPLDRFGITVLFGPSGCGKTTILRCLAGLERPQTGSIRAGDDVWFDAAAGVFQTPQTRSIGFLFQDYALFPHLTVAENIAFGLAQVPRDQRLSRVAAVLSSMRLDGLGDRYPRQISGGQQQRVALARAVARRPRLLLLDEPLSALDAPTREQLRRELRRMLAELGVPAVVVTHDRVEALSLADQVIVLDHGRVLQTGPAHEVFTRPKDPTVARMAGVETIEPARVVRVEQGLATVQIGELQVTAVAGAVTPGDVFLCIRGEDVILQTAVGPASSARNRLDGRIVAITPEGPLVRVLIDCGFRLTALVTRPARDELGLVEGGAVTAVLKAPSIHLVPRG